jgi:hypothetical protein
MNVFVSVSAGISPLDSFSLDNLRDNLGQVPDDFIVSEYAVYSALSRLKMSKSTCGDVLSNRLLVDRADILAAPICAIINSSIRQGIVPSQWKIAKVLPIPKIIHPIAIESDLRPISVTSGISKVAESFICSFFFNISIRLSISTSLDALIAILLFMH